MKIDLHNLEEGINIVRFVEKADAIGITDELFCPGPIEVDLTVIRTGDRLHLKGKVAILVKLECSRCLTNFRKRIQDGFEVFVSFIPQRLTEGIASWDEEFLAVSTDAHTVDITELVREVILLAIPIKPLCQEDCKGLCPVCGRNLNEGDCDCHRKRIDPRWAALGKLLEGP